MKLDYFWQIFEKFSNKKIYENQSSDNRIVHCRQTDMTELIAVFRNFANVPSNSQHSNHTHHET